MIDGLDGKKRSISKFQKCFGASHKIKGKDNKTMEMTLSEQKTIEILMRQISIQMDEKKNVNYLMQPINQALLDKDKVDWYLDKLIEHHLMSVESGEEARIYFKQYIKKMENNTEPNQGKAINKMKLLKEHLFEEDCEEEDHNNWYCLLSELSYDEEALEYYTDIGVIGLIDAWIEHVEGAWYFGARIYLHKETNDYFWVYENLKGGDGSYGGTEDTSWIDLGNGTIQDWIDVVKHKEAVIERLP
jgi:hypothetical protein